MGNSGCFPRGKPVATESRNPTYCACWVFKCFHNLPNSDMVFRIFNLCTNVNACGCTQGCTDTVRESAPKAASGRKISCHTGEPNLPQRRAGTTLYQLSYIPNPICSIQFRYPTLFARQVTSIVGNSGVVPHYMLDICREPLIPFAR